MYDYHTHSFFSADCDTPMSAMAEAAIFRKVDEIAITDHYDPDYHDPDFTFTPDFPAYHTALLDVEDHYRKKILIKKGIELGIQHNVIDELNAEVNSFQYDFVLGSFHSCCGKDLFRGDFFEGRAQKEIYRDFYTYMYECLKNFKSYDVIGHFNIVDRYIDKVGPDSLYMDIVDEILKMIIEDGKGLEVNTSVFRYNTPVSLPRIEILKHYKELGGTIVTTGSDSHLTRDICGNFKDAYELLKSCGFDRIATFTNHQPTLIKF